MIKLTPTTAPVGTRCLITHMTGSEHAAEVTVLEWSPSGKRANLHYATQPPGCSSWMSAHEVEWTEVLEVLPPIEVLRPPYQPTPNSTADVPTSDPHARF